MELKPGWRTTEGGGAATVLVLASIVVADPERYGQWAVVAALLAGAVAVHGYAQSRSNTKTKATP